VENADDLRSPERGLELQAASVGGLFRGPNKFQIGAGAVQGGTYACHPGWNQGLCVRSRPMIRKLQSGEYRLYSRKLNPKTGKRRNLGTFKSRAAAEKHERDVQYFKRH
jgi:hypothetical protein